MPLSLRILIGVVLGTLLGIATRLIPHSIAVRFSWLLGIAPTLGQLGLLVVRMLKALATPLILFAILDAFLHTHIPPRKGARLLALSALNAVVAIGIGLLLANVFHAGSYAHDTFATLVRKPTQAHSQKPPAEATLDPLTNFSGYIPESLIDPFSKNSVISVVILAVLIGAALRSVRNTKQKVDAHSSGHVDVAAAMVVIEQLVRVAMLTLVRVLEWVIQLMPYAVFGIVARVVRDTGPGVFRDLGLFLVVVLVGLFLHAVVWYGAMRRAVGWKSGFYRQSSDAIVTALSCGSSLATLPVTLRCLDDKLRVSRGSSRLAAIVGSNLNHDGIILYEAAAALFLAQAFGHSLDAGQQVSVALAAVMAGIGIAGVPEAGLITLPLVLGAARLPSEIVLVAAPLMLPVDWIIGRFRAATNVVSDMTVSIVLDQLDARDAKKENAAVDAQESSNQTE